jgi:hypothetical protein
MYTSYFMEHYDSYHIYFDIIIINNVFHFSNGT